MNDLSPLLKMRLSGVPKSSKKLYERAISGKATPRAAIRAKCAECMGWERKEVANCTSVLCPLHKYRPLSKDQKSLLPAKKPRANAFGKKIRPVGRPTTPEAQKSEIHTENAPESAQVKAA